MQIIQNNLILLESSQAQDVMVKFGQVISPPDQMSQRLQSLESLFKGISEIFWKSEEEKIFKNVKLLSEDLIFFSKI